jgi:hypothetical protein
VTQIHDELIEEFSEVCRFCKEGAEKHAEGVCLFDATLFTPMTPAEWVEWRRQELLSDAGFDYLRDQIRQQGFARQVAAAQPQGSLLKMNGPEYIKQHGLFVPPPPVMELDWQYQFYETPSVAVDVTPRICRHCQKERDTHLDGKCLFEASVFEPMSMEELVRWATTNLNHAAGFSIGTTTGRLSSRDPNLANLPREKPSQLKQEFLGSFLFPDEEPEQ